MVYKKVIDRSYAYVWGGPYHLLGVNLEPFKHRPPRRIAVNGAADEFVYTRCQIDIKAEGVIQRSYCYIPPGADKARVKESLDEIVTRASWLLDDGFVNTLTIAMECEAEWLVAQANLILVYQEQPHHTVKEKLAYRREMKNIIRRWDLFEKHLSLDADKMQIAMSTEPSVSRVSR